MTTTTPSRRNHRPVHDEGEALLHTEISWHVTVLFLTLFLALASSSRVPAASRHSLDTYTDVTPPDPSKSETQGNGTAAGAESIEEEALLVAIDGSRVRIRATHDDSWKPLEKPAEQIHPHVTRFLQSGGKEPRIIVMQVSGDRTTWNEVWALRNAIYEASSGKSIVLKEGPATSDSQGDTSHAP